MSRVRFGVLAAAFLLLLNSSITFAQSDLSTITGVIKDASGSTVPGAKVSVRNEATGIERQTTSSESGTFSITNLPSGLYTVIVEKQGGFKKFETTGNKLDASVPLAVDVKLEVGATTETVQVQSDASGVETVNATLSQVVNATQIRSAPLNRWATRR